jgi:hypothetical protein
MQDGPDFEPGERGGRRRLTPRSALAFAGIVAIAAAAGLVVSFGQRPTPKFTQPSPSARLLITPSPVPREPRSGFGFSVADDLATHEVVLFGGVGNYANTWLWNGSSWRLVHPPASPEARFGASEAYDPQTRTVLLFGGRLEPGTPVHDTWSWNGTTWEPLDMGAAGPRPGEASDMAWDPALNEMVLLTSSGVISSPAETWVWAGTHWSRPAGASLPAAASYSPMWFDPVTRSLLAVGCCVGPPPATGAADTTWRWNGATWTLLAPAHAPIGGSTMAMDPAIGRVVLCACGSWAPLSSLFAWGGGDWTALRAGAIPVDNGTAITDDDLHKFLLFGIPKSAILPGQSPVEIWSLTASGWARLGPAQ